MANPSRITTPAPPAAPDPADLLAWYDRHRRRLPWRALPGETPDPYRVWLSEIMLQQTTVAAVGRYFARFTELWPTVEALAAAPSEQVMAEWAGLGYYARARNLHACARTVAGERSGRFPEDEAGLRTLPGVGTYTAGAIAAIAFDRPHAAVDGNVERVMARLHAVETPLAAAKPRLRALTQAMVPTERAGDFAQALMDLGATICTPRRPKCALCPWMEPCAARRLGIQEQLPVRAPKAELPLRTGQAWWGVRAGDGLVLLRRRPPQGLLGGMLEVPSSGWDGGTECGPPMAAAWRALPGHVAHGITHFRLELTVHAATLPADAAGPDDAVWADPAALGALPSLMRKVARHALKHG